MKQKN